MTYVDATEQRRLALSYAVTLNTPLGSDVNAGIGRVLTTATALFDWLVGPAFLDIIVGEIVDQSTKLPTGNTHTGGTVQLHDNEQVTFTVSEADAKGVALKDTLTWTSSDETVFTLVVSADTQSALAVAGVPGSAVLTVTDGALSATAAVDVVPGNVATISIAAGTPEPQPAAPATSGQSAEPIQAGESGQGPSTVDTGATAQ